MKKTPGLRKSIKEHTVWLFLLTIFVIFISTMENDTRLYFFDKQEKEDQYIRGVINRIEKKFDDRTEYIDRLIHKHQHIYSDGRAVFYNLQNRLEWPDDI